MSVTSEEWMDKIPVCPICGYKLKEHWRGKPCMSNENDEPTK